jgi:hypothetical protein
MTATDRDEAILEYLDDIEPKDWPGTITVEGFAPMQIADGGYPDADDLLDEIYERLDEDFANEEATTPTPGIKAAAEWLCATIRREYEPWACESVTEKVTVNVIEWVNENCPDWLLGRELLGESADG